ncbi:unnamed protein product [Bacillus thuringiensis DB27]|uniref:Uncharacterized protein n=1 Tax=Bacillus thuringiensis DB27 TaxID=1431339 RepID=W8ZB32_BACTU|nr:unnamed protein product [Bacillus thuringiensis DB27]
MNIDALLDKMFSLEKKALRQCLNQAKQLKTHNLLFMYLIWH